MKIIFVIKEYKMYDLDPDDIKKLQRYFLQELKLQGFDDFRHIGDGAHKRAYSAKRNNHMYAIKVMGTQEGKNESDLQDKILQLMGSSPPSFVATNDYYESTLDVNMVLDHLLERHPEEEEEVTPLYLYLSDVQQLREPFLVYEISDLYEMTTEEFFYKEKWTWAQFKNIFCQIINALHYLQLKKISFTDFKLNNVMINKNTLQIFFIDYYNSAYQCDFEKCKDDDNLNYTYYDIFYKKINFHQDIFRIGINLLHAIEIRNKGQWKIERHIGTVVSQPRHKKKECKQWLFFFQDCDDMTGKDAFHSELQNYLIKFENHLQHMKQLPTSDKTNLMKIIKQCVFINPSKPYTIPMILKNSFFAKCKN